MYPFIGQRKRLSRNKPERVLKSEMRLQTTENEQREAEHWPSTSKKRNG